MAERGGVLRARLRRVAPSGTALAAFVPAAPQPSVERIAAAAAGRAARRVGGLVAAAEAVRSQGISLAEMPELLPEQALIAVVEAPGDRLGVVALCPMLLASLIEVQAIGHLTARPVPPRRPTRADAALAADFVNHLLDELAGTVAALPGHAALAGYRYASYLDDPRPLTLMLEDGGFRAIRVDLRLGAGGERRGTLFVAVPATPAGEAPPVAPVAAIPSAPEQPRVSVPTTTLAAAVRQAPVPVVAVLCRRRISLRELRALQPGATIALPRAAVDEAWLETLRGQKLTRGKLGEVDGFHALRLRPLAAASETPPAGGSALAAGLRLPGRVQADDTSSLPTTAGTEAEPPIIDLSTPDAFRFPEDEAADVLPMQQVAS